MSALTVEEVYQPEISVPLEEAGAKGVRVTRLHFAGVEYHAIQAYEPIHEANAVPEHRWHISVSGREDVPPWHVMSEVVHALRPGVPFVIGIPPRSWWMNVHPNVLHAHELKDANLIAQWRAEGEGHTPT
jgi:hypothetical protein